MPFSPTDLANLWGWWKADAGVTGTTTVTAWADQSGNGNDLSATAGSEPALDDAIINSLPVISSYERASKMLTAVNWPGPSQATVYIVARQKYAGVINETNGVFLQAGGPYNVQLRRSNADNIIEGGIDSNITVTSPTITDDTFYTIRLRADGTNVYISINNGVEVQVVKDSIGHPDFVLSLFSTNTGANPGVKQIAEVIIYTDNKTGNDSDLTEYYLQQKYNHYTWTGAVPTSDVQAVITFPNLPSKTVGDADFAPGATSNSPATITYASSNTSVATIVGGNIHIVGAGTTTITASQGATSGYAAASDVSKTLTVSAAPVTTSNSKLYGLWRIDGIDIWTTYGVALETGSADFLKFPPKKQSIEHDWGDSDGIDVDLSRIYTGKREGVLNFAIFANTNEEYFNKHDAFFALWKQPGTRRLEIAAHNNRSYLIYYQETNNWQQIAALEPVSLDGNSYLIAHKFSIVVVEPEPKLYPGNVYIVTEDGKFLIT